MLSVLLLVMKTKIHAKLNAFVHKPCSINQNIILLHTFCNFASYWYICDLTDNNNNDNNAFPESSAHAWHYETTTIKSNKCQITSNETTKQNTGVHPAKNN